MFLPIVLQEKQVDLLPRLKEKVNPPEGVPRLFDLVKVEDERMKLAFFSALGNTVVAKDTDQVPDIFFFLLMSSWNRYFAKIFGPLLYKFATLFEHALFTL